MSLYRKVYCKEGLPIIDGKYHTNLSSDHTFLSGIFRGWPHAPSWWLEEVSEPTQDDLDKEINKFLFIKHLDDGQYNDGQIDGFELGATWMKNKLFNK